MSTDNRESRGTRESVRDSVEHWFATSPLDCDLEATESGSAMGPDMFLVHAKRLGTTLSACGLDTAMWHKYWISFHRFPSEQACLSCIDEVARRPVRADLRW